MRDVSRRAVLRTITASVAGSVLISSVPRVTASQHEPPSADDVTVRDDAVEYIEQDPDAGFNYPYFLYTPPSLDRDTEGRIPILVAPNNSPSSEDAYATHLEFAKDLVSGGRPRRIAERLPVPLLVPVFPRYRDSPQPWHVYVQVLDPSTFTLEDSPLERVDLQLVSMIDDATSRLEENGYRIAPQVHIDGFSASGSFTNRFTVLHPERVNAASHGGTTMKTLPKTTLDDDVPVVGDPKWAEMSYPPGTEEQELPYPIGVANLEYLTGSEFNEEAWLDTPQYIYIGNEDRPEPGSRGHRSFANLPPKDIQQIHPDDRSYRMPDLINDIFGVKNIDERFSVSQAVYENVGADVTFRIYDGYGHTPRPAMDHLVQFHNEKMKTFRPDTTEPSGTRTTATESSTPSASPTDRSTQTNAATATTGSEVPGFGIGATLTAIGGAGYALKRQRDSDT